MKCNLHYYKWVKILSGPDTDHYHIPPTVHRAVSPCLFGWKLISPTLFSPPESRPPTDHKRSCFASAAASFSRHIFFLLSFSRPATCERSVWGADRRMCKSFYSEQLIKMRSLFMRAIQTISKILTSTLAFELKVVRKFCGYCLIISLGLWDNLRGL